VTDTDPDHEALADGLADRGFLVNDRTEQAVRDTPRAPLLDATAEPLAPLDVPAPIVDATRQAAPCPSPRVVVTVLEAADVEPGDTVLVLGRGVVWAAALADRLAGEAGRVLAVEDDEHLVGAARERLDAHADDATVLAALDELEVSPDRILVLEPGRGDDDLAPRLADDGVLVRPVADEDGVDLVRTFRTGEHTASVHLGETRVAAQAEGLHEAAPGGLLVGQMLGAEALLRDAWTRVSGGTTADDVREAVAETIGRALAERGLRAEHPVEARTAQGAFHVAYVHQMTGEFQLAIDAYTASADLLETSEAYTFRGWTRSFMDDVDGAIADCKTAIDVDPAFGNPYNDIGAYLLEENRPGEAVEWLEEAADAERYSSRHFPYLNLGRAHLELGNRDRAREALERALELDPGNEAAERLLRRLGDAQS